MSELALESVTKQFDDGTIAVRDVTLTVPDGELMVLVGPSGSGKTTVLRIVAGLEEATKGTVRIGDRVVNDVDPRDRDIAMVFQNYALYPHMTVAQNMGFALRLAKVSKRKIERRVSEAAELLEIESLLQRRPRQLSGGQRQRVAMGRAIVREPQLFLMDEPLSNLDAKLRVQMRAEIRELQQRLDVTTLYVTHDQTEAMTMGDEVAVLRGGRVEQLATPQELYDHPANLFVAVFIGSPAMNTLSGRLERDDGTLVVRTGSVSLPVPPRAVEETPELPSHVGKEVVVGIRPDDLHQVAPTDGGLAATVTLVEHLGSEMLVHAEVAAAAGPAADELEGTDEDGGPSLAAPVTSTPARVLAKMPRKVSIGMGDSIRLAPDAAGLRFFDRATGVAIR
jgi:multiple sugar transport system ATP-binding protein